MRQAGQGNKDSSSSGLANTAKEAPASKKDLEQVQDLLGTWLTDEEFVDFLHAQPDYHNYPGKYLRQIWQRKERWDKEWWLIDDPALSASFQRLKEAVHNYLRESVHVLFPSASRSDAYEIPSEWAGGDRTRWDKVYELMMCLDGELEEALCELRKTYWSRS